MKIWCQLPQSLPEKDFKVYYDLLYADYNLVKRPDTEIVIKDVPTGFSDPDLMTYIGSRFVNDREILRSMLQAERDGYDAVAGACYFDGVIKEAANLMNIPVVGPAEASMHLASMIGDHFAVVTSEDRWVYEMERHLMDCKMRNFSITLHPVRALTISLETLFSCLGGNYEPVVEDFKKVAKTCIQDGADVIITGCGLVSPMITQSGNSEIGGVPVIDPMLVSLKVAELMVDFYRAGLPLKNASGRFLRPVAEQVHEIRKAIGL